MIFAPVERIEQVIQLALEDKPVDTAATTGDPGNGTAREEKRRREERPRGGRRAPASVEQITRHEGPRRP